MHGIHWQLLRFNFLQILSRDSICRRRATTPTFLLPSHYPTTPRLFYEPKESGTAPLSPQLQAYSWHNLGRFDGEHYRDLCKKVVVDGNELSHCYFSGKFDIALSICTDSYLLFERRR
ncbi:hypothetical protein FB451DRAFT_1274566, partial [Mycena latifolia]